MPRTQGIRNLALGVIISHGHRQEFVLLVNAKVDSMGGFIDCGVGLDTKTSPRRAAIEKTNADLRQEFDVREERKRELEFLEKGGDPLDFRSSGATSISLQSSSFRDQQTEHYVISEAKGSSALADSPDGDSIESSGRPGGSVTKEPNIADNLLLLDGENRKPGGERNGKRTGKRGMQVGKSNAKETEDSLIFHLGVRRQAYARRNRTRPSRDSHNNKSTPSSVSDHKDGKKSSREEYAENRGISVSNSKPASPDVNSKALVSDSLMDMQLDDIQAHHVDKVREGEEVNVSENKQDKSHSTQNLPSEQIGNLTASVSSELSGKDKATSVELTENVEDTSNTEKVEDSSIPNNDGNAPDTDMKRNNSVITSHANKGNNSAGNTNNDSHGRVRVAECRSTGDSKDSSVQGTSDNNVVRKEDMLIDAGAPSNGNDESRSTVRIKDEVEFCDNPTEMSDDVKPLANNTESLKTNGEVVLKPERKLDNCLVDSSHSINKAGVITSSLVPPTSEPLTTASSKRGDTATSLKLVKKANEEAILKEARIIKANHKRIIQLSTSYKPPEKRKKCHWDFVLEEMAWMANDFAQERLWKRAAAAHMCHQIASSGRPKFQQKIICRKQRCIARTLAKAVMHFWHSADVIRTSKEANDHAHEECNSDSFGTSKVNGTTTREDQVTKNLEVENNCHQHAIQAYAVRFLKYDCVPSNHPILAEAPTTPDRITDAGILQLEDESSEESLFYRVQSGAMQVYREAVESKLVNYKKKDNVMHQEDCEASLCDSLPDGPRENEYEEEEGETGSYYLPGKFEGTMSSKFTHKKRKNFQQKSFASRQYDGFSDFPYDPYLVGKSQIQPLVFSGKRPSSTLNAGSIPTKRVRTATRQRTVGPFSAGATGSLQITTKTDASSGDTNSFQDDQNSMHGGSKPWKNMEVESTMDYEKQLPFDSCEISTKSKKKSKHLGYSTNHSDSGALVVSGKGSMFDQRLQSDNFIHHEQREQVKKRLESPHYESNGKIGIYGQHASKKPKLLKHLTEPSPDGIMSPAGSMISAVASQTSNMPNQKKLIKIIANRDRGRKNKSMKMAAGQLGSGIPWTTLEDQALVVLVHDMGPNWELVSDAINSTLQFKCIFRKPIECRERHKFLIDQSGGDGADSAEDSGSSQPYPSTLPGIPKAREVLDSCFNAFKDQWWEDTLKAHFEKIILGQQMRSCRSLKDSRELKQLTPVHNSHVTTISQANPNNLAGGFLSPLDICNLITSSPDPIAHGSQGSHTSSAPLPNHQGSPSPVLSTSSVNTMMQGSSGNILGGNIPSPSTVLNAPSRDAPKYGMPRMASLPVDDQQRPHYARMVPGRNNQPYSMSGHGVPIGVDRGAYILPSGNGMMAGRAMPRTSFPAISSPSMPVVSGGSMLAGGVGMSNPSGVHSVPVSGPGNSMLRPHDMSMLRPGQNTEDRRQAMMQDLQLQASQGNSSAVPSFNSLSAPYSPATGIPSIPPYPSQQPLQPHPIQHQPLLGAHHHPHIHGTNQSGGPQQQAYAMRLAKEQQLQRMMPQSQQPYPSSISMAPVQNNLQLDQQQTQHNKQQVPRGPQPVPTGLPNQATKQRQRQQKQILQQQTKLMKNMGRGTAMMHQTLPVDPAQVGNPTAAPRNQGFFPGSSGTTGLPQSPNHQKIYSSRPPPQSSKQMTTLPSHSDALLSSSIPLATQKQRQMNQNMQRMMLQQNRPLTSDGRIQSSCDPAQAINQTALATSIPPPSVSSDVQWKPEASCDASTPSSTDQLAGVLQEKMVGPETSVPSSSEGSEQRQFTRSVSMDGHGGSVQWQQQQQLQPLLQPQLQRQQQPEHSGLHQKAVQGNLHERPSNVGPG